MIRTQIYLPEDIHASLKKMAKMEGTTFSRLIRQGAEVIVKEKLGSKPQQRALRFFANPPSKYRLKITGKQAAEQIRRDRDA